MSGGGAFLRRDSEQKLEKSWVCVASHIYLRKTRARRCSEQVLLKLVQRRVTKRGQARWTETAEWVWQLCEGAQK